MTAVDSDVFTAGVHDDMPPDVYHAHPALSASGAKLLLPPSCPAKYRWWADHPQPPKRHFDFGHAAHAEVLGIGDPIHIIDAANYKTKAAQEEKKAAYADGETPLLAVEWEQVQAMATAIRAHPVAGALFDPAGGTPEVSLFWHDEIFDVDCRARLDWLINQPMLIQGKPRIVIPDYKTCAAADPVSLAKSMHEYGYHQQTDWYGTALLACGLADDKAPPLPLLVAQEKEPPYLVTLAQPDAEAMRVAATRNRKALDVYAACAAAGVWPGYADDVVQLPLPGYALAQHDQAMEQGAFDIDWQLPIPSGASL
jgi:hypothetical protein